MRSKYVILYSYQLPASDFLFVMVIQKYKQRQIRKKGGGGYGVRKVWCQLFKFSNCFSCCLFARSEVWDVALTHRNTRLVHVCYTNSYVFQVWFPSQPHLLYEPSPWHLISWLPLLQHPCAIRPCDRGHLCPPHPHRRWLHLTPPWETALPVFHHGNVSCLKG